MEHNLETRSRRRWTLGLATLFVSQLGLWAVAVTAVVDDPSHAVVDNYGGRAHTWDEQQRIRAASDALGWTVELNLAMADSVRVRIVDRAGIEVRGAGVQGTVFHRAAASRRMGVQFEEREPGVYYVDRPDLCAGLWHLEIKVIRGQDVYLGSYDQNTEIRGSTCPRSS